MKEGQIIKIISSEGKYYTGCHIPHDEELCPDCQNNKPCQGQVEGDYMKMGKMSIDPGEYEVWDIDGTFITLRQKKEEIIYEIVISQNEKNKITYEINKTDKKT